MLFKVSSSKNIKTEKIYQEAAFKQKNKLMMRTKLSAIPLCYQGDLLALLAKIIYYLCSIVKPFRISIYIIILVVSVKIIKRKNVR